MGIGGEEVPSTEVGAIRETAGMPAVGSIRGGAPGRDGGHADCGSGRRSLAVLATLLPLLVPVAAGASPRPTIGIAFSGGGAKGCAHIGVLRVLEELRIPVDYVAGTSMGAIIGGLYASGLGPDELEETILAVDWADALRDKPGRRDLTFRRKDDDLRYIPGVELGVGRGGLRYPTGLRSGQKLNYLLRRFTLPVRTIRDFDQLPIPFRAVATDIATGEMVVLGSGDLARALRASMAIPSVFTPVEIDGRLLVDGGVTDNVPVDVVRAMGADVVIAIDIGAQFAEDEEVGRSLLAILGQTNRMITRGNMIARLAAADIVVTPDISGIGTLEFHRGREIIARGEAEARRMTDLLARYALDEGEYERWKSARRREPDPLPIVTRVEIEGNQRVDRRALATQIRLRAGAPFSAETAREDLSRLFGLGDFETVDVAIEPEGDEVAVVYQVREKSWGPTYLRFGLGFRADLEGESDLSVLAQANRTRINALGAEWKTELQLGSDRVLRTGFYQPLSFDPGWFVEPSAGYRRLDLVLFADSEPVAELDVEGWSTRLDLGYNFGRYGEARLGVERAELSPRRRSGMLPATLAALDGASFQRAGVALSAVVDRLDSATLPKDGSIGRLTAYRALEELGADDEYTRLELRAARFDTRGRHTVFADLGAGASPGGTLPIYDRFSFGGFFSLSGYLPGEIAGDNYGFVRIGYYLRLGGPFHAGGHVELLGVADRFGSVAGDPIVTGTALLIADTQVGPFYLAAGAGETGHRKLYVVFGRQF